MQCKHRVSFLYSLKNNILFILSGFCFLWLVLQINRIGLLISLAVLLLVVFVSVTNENILKKFKKCHDLNKLISGFSAIALLIVLALRFISTWMPSGKIHSVAAKIHMSNVLFLSIVSVFFAVLSFFFVAYVFSLFFAKIKELIPTKWIVFFFGGVVLIIAINIIAYFMRNSNFNIACLFLEGVFSLVLLYCLLLYTIKSTNLSLIKADYIVIAAMISVSFLIYFIVVSARTSIYVWDYTTYFERMRYLSAEYSYSAIGGVREWFFSGMQNDYGCFLNIFIYPFFFFTNGSIQAFIFSYYFACVVPSMFVLYCFSKWMIDRMINKEQSTLIKAIVGIIVVAFPLLHSASIQGMPDVFGLTFAGIIILLTMSYGFAEKDYLRWIVLFVVTVCIILTRRWYIFFVIGYYISYFLVLFVKTILGKDKITILAVLKNTLFFGISCCILGLIVFDRMINMILGNNYNSAYSSWNQGGFWAEIPNQIQLLGVIVFLVIVFGWVAGLFNRKTRHYTIILLLSNLISLFAFTRIQNMGHHQSLILFPCYFWGIMLSLSFLYLQKQKILCIIPAIAVAFSAVNCLCIDTSNTVTDIVFSKLDLYPHQRLDTKGLDEINNFFVNVLKSDEKVQVLAASREYDSEVFTHYPQPFSNLYYYRNNFLAPSGGFPEGFFDAQYLLVINPIQERDIVKNEHVLHTIITEFNQNLSVNAHFILEKTIKLQDGIEAMIYKRIVPADNDEVTVFINAFSDYCNQYPELFYDRLVKHLQ